MSTARETFGRHSGEYAAARPRYPEHLFEWMASLCPERTLAWDCATGNGQAAIGLARHFSLVEATDISAEQIANAIPEDNVHYSVQPAEGTRLDRGTVNLIAIAQALHWFDHERFWPEVRRVAHERALVVAWGYDWLYLSDEIDARVIAPIRRVIHPFWAANNRLLWEGYQTEAVKFPWARLAVPAFSLQMSWTIEQTLAYMQTWSAYRLGLANSDAAAELAQIASDARTLVGPDERLDVRMPLKILAGFVA